MPRQRAHLGLTMSACILLVAAATAQTNHTGVITGRVSDPSGLPLGGVRVTASSPALQGTRTSITSAHGDYVIPFLPPGDYKVSFAHDDFQTLQASKSLAVAETASLDVELSLAGVVEAITVVSEPRELFGPEAPAATTYRGEAIDKLPVSRDLRGAVLMAPGAASTGPGGSLTIAGAMTSDGLYLVDGVVVNNVSVGREPRPLYIEDAIEETRTLTANISAEYGRFVGGVVNAVTKSGGNDFSGSLRATLNNERWRALTPFEKSRVAGDPRRDEIVPTWEATLGGPIVRDKLWFFAAGRTQDSTLARTLAVTNIPYENVTDETRYEGKLTWSLGPEHTFRGAYTGIDADEKNRSFQLVMDRASLYPSEFPEELVSLNYTGILTPSLFVEAQYSRRKRDRVGVGSRLTDLVGGTVIVDRFRGAGNNFVWNSPIFCAVCGIPAGELRRDHEWNQDIIVKASYFLSTPRLGSHNLVGGLDVFDEGRQNNQWQTGSGFSVFATSTVVRGEELFPMFTPGTTFIRWAPIFERSRGGRYRTYSVFANDVWRPDDRFSFNVGLRWDKNDAKDQAGRTVAGDDAFSPRLAMSFDPKGDGNWTVNAGFARYVAALNNDIGEDGSAGGRPSRFDYTYGGPAINADPNALDPVPADQALTILFDWFFANGGTDRPLRGAPFIPGLNRTVAEEGLIPPSTYEYALGVAKRLGNKGLLRVDGVWRDFRDFYTLRADLATGKVTDSAGRVYDLQIITNSNAVERNYGAVMIQTAYRFDERLLVNASYTLSRTRGNSDGEERTELGGAVSNDTLLFYPEYGEARWRAPTADLKIDQRHKARLWLNYDVPISPGIGLLDVALHERIESGQPFSSDSVIDSSRYVANPGYSTPPATVPYFFGGRGDFATETVTATDVSINYARGLGFSKKAELFLRFIVLNVFNESARTRPGEETVLTNSNDPRYAPFDPFTETPVRGVHWDLGPRFGEAVNADDYQTPRTFSFAAGFRF